MRHGPGSEAPSCAKRAFAVGFALHLAGLRADRLAEPEPAARVSLVEPALA